MEEKNKLIFRETPLKESYIIEPVIFTDKRGFFSRNFCKNELSEIGFNKNIVQINHSKTLKKGMIRGLHYQLSPFAETKIVKCIRGKIFDVIVDLRKNSPTFLKWFSVELSEDNRKLIYIPEGFAHGFQAGTER